MLIILITNQIANGTIYLNIAAFLPLYVQQRWPAYITPTMVSLILSSFELASIVFSKVHQLTINKMGRKNAILIAYGILCIATACIGTLDYLDDSQWVTFYILAILLRICQGYADSLAVST